MTGFRVEQESVDDQTQLVVVHGEVDLHHANELRDAIAEAASEGKPRVVVDASDVPFMDSSGLAALVTAHKDLHADAHLVVVCPENLRRIFEVTGLDVVMNVVGSLAEALVA